MDIKITFISMVLSSKEECQSTYMVP